MKLDQAPNFDYLGQPINSYFLIRHVALGWDKVRTKGFQAENATRSIFGKSTQMFAFVFNLNHSYLDRLRQRETAEKLPDHGDIEGAAFGLARLHSLYSLDGTKMVQEGVIAADIKNGIRATSLPSIKLFTCK